VKFFWYSVKGFGLSMAQRVQAEGNDVVFYQEVKNEKSKGRVGRGLVPLASSPRPDPDAIVVFDFSGAGKKADAFRKAGNPVFGGSAFADALEENREFACQLMRANGIKTPTSAFFTSMKKGVEFVHAHPKPLVFKPSGKDMSAALTVVGDNNDDLAKDMERIAKIEGDKIPFCLQEKVEGIECSIEGWFNGMDWVYHSINSTLEEKRFMTGSVGPNTGCMGNVVWFYRHARPKLAKDTLYKLTQILRRADYRGPIDVNTKGGYALEFTPRFGYDAIQTAIMLMHDDLGGILSDVARGQARRFNVSFDFATGVTLSLPPFPGSNLDELAEQCGTPVRFPPELYPFFHLGDVMLDDEGQLVTAGNDGVVGVMTATGATSVASTEEAYRRVEQVKVPDLQYRLDIGERARKEIPQLLRKVKGNGE
jgi:phosphoribosylamine--glycine ligase